MYFERVNRKCLEFPRFYGFVLPLSLLCASKPDAHGGFVSYIDRDLDQAYAGSNTSAVQQKILANAAFNGFVSAFYAFAAIINPPETPNGAPPRERYDAMIARSD